MEQYLQTKEEYNDTILFYRLGDFYEMFFDDAKTVSRELEITLTGKDCGMSERAPMCGVPFHSANNYISRLIEKGYKVAICEQVEDPKTAKGLVKREVVRIVTPGTVVESEMLPANDNNYLASVYCGDGAYGITFADVSTGEIYATCVKEMAQVVNEMARYLPSEILVNEKCPEVLCSEILLRIRVRPAALINDFYTFSDMNRMITGQFENASELDFNIVDSNALKTSVCSVLKYMEYTQKSSFSYINHLKLYSIDEYMDLDAATRRNLEITETMRDKAKKGSLLWVLDSTKTAMGSRLLKQWIEKPLVDPALIRERLNTVEELSHNVIIRDELTEALGGIYDISRITSRVSLGNVTPRDLLSLHQSLVQLPIIKEILSRTKSRMLTELSDKLETADDIREHLFFAIKEDAPALLRDGDVIKPGYNEELDKLRLARDKGSQWVYDLEAKERESTGIKNLKIKYNKVFGYYIEVSKMNNDKVPDYYVRKQTVVNAERYITPELKSIENTILGASEKIIALEAELFARIVSMLRDNMERLKNICYIISVCDVLCSFSVVASKNNFVKPDISDGESITIKDGRHPVVEKMNTKNVFVPNDTTLDCGDNRLMIITGPNMAGKSTYMRQVAIISLMAQIGSFVPATFARLCVVDKIFTRVGASDDIAAGQSTFMVEMSEVAHILSEATSKSLIILDEIGRGTSTYDGLSIAWSVAEYIHGKNIGAKTLFATHYHELTQLEDKLEGVKNYNIAVKKRGDDITFLRKIVPGGTDESYGIEVAALAGVPPKVIKRAKEILASIEDGGKDNVKIKASEAREESNTDQVSFADTAALSIAEELKNLDATTLTPIEAMNTLYQLSQKAREILN